jgi:hypothetical protein
MTQVVRYEGVRDNTIETIVFVGELKEAYAVCDSLQSNTLYAGFSMSQLRYGIR